MPSTVIPTTIDVILLAVQAQLITSLGFPAERVIINDPELIDALDFNAQADAYLVIWPERQTNAKAQFEGGGRLDTRMNVDLIVEVRTRTALDEPTSRLAWLTDSGLGHVRSACSPVWNALTEFIPVDGSTPPNALTTGPFFPFKWERPHPDRKKKEWGKSQLMFQFQYVMALAIPPY